VNLVAQVVGRVLDVEYAVRPAIGIRIVPRGSGRIAIGPEQMAVTPGERREGVGLGVLPVDLSP